MDTQALSANMLCKTHSSRSVSFAELNNSTLDIANYFFSYVSRKVYTYLINLLCFFS